MFPWRWAECGCRGDEEGVSSECCVRTSAAGVDELKSLISVTLMLGLVSYLSQWKDTGRGVMGERQFFLKKQDANQTCGGILKEKNIQFVMCG